MNFLLGIDKSQYGDAIIETEGVGETFLFGGQIVLIGMVTIFAVLGLIWACLTVFKLVFHDIPAKRKENAVSNDNVGVTAAEPVVYTANDDEIVAVIAAAIAAAESESGSAAKFRVVSFRRK
ncbi:MAG: OadG family protein [Clostridia bacterium]|nr:OadG family protein [Clostridia bacterium]